jgi:short-subunit dehydrogenase
VNCAATSVYGRLDEIPLEDKRRVLDVTFWGVVHGCRSSLPHLRVNGGALINIGSVESDRAIPLHGIYAAAKHAVKAYTDTLRMESEKARDPISVTLIKPASIDTPFFEHSRSYMDAEPAPPPPVYAPDVVAETILHCATKPVRDIYVGGSARILSASAWHAPRLTDRVMERTLFDAQKADRPNRPDRRDALYEPMNDGAERGLYDGTVLERSAYTTAALHPRTTVLAAVGVGMALALGWRAWRRDDAGARSA